jgi:nucleotide-binding universal stress UspA family protein
MTMLQINNVLATTDLSDCGEAAIPFAVALARQHDATLHLAFVEEVQPVYFAGEPVFGMSGPPAMPQLEWVAAARKEHQLRLKDIADRLTQTEQLKVITHFKDGSPARRILETAGEIHADCLVMSTHGRSGLSRLVFGSVTENVLRHSPCPVLCVKPGETPGGPGPLLFTTDLSKESLRALNYAISLAKQQRRELHMLMVVDDRMYMPADGGMPVKAVEWMVDERRKMEAKLKELAERVRGETGLVVTVHVRHGNPAEQIVNVADFVEAASVVMASHGRTGLKRLVLGSVAEQVVRNSARPVLTIRATETAGQPAEEKLLQGIAG